MTVTPEALKAREERGLIIAAKCKLAKKGPVWLVPSQSSNAKYTVCPDKLLCHNICCLISAIYELGIDPVFWSDGTGNLHNSA